MTTAGGMVYYSSAKELCKELDGEHIIGIVIECILFLIDLIRFPATERLTRQQTRKPLAYRESTCTILRKPTLTGYSGVKSENLKCVIIWWKRDLLSC